LALMKGRFELVDVVAKVTDHKPMEHVLQGHFSQGLMNPTCCSIVLAEPGEPRPILVHRGGDTLPQFLWAEAAVLLDTGQTSGVGLHPPERHRITGPGPHQLRLLPPVLKHFRHVGENLGRAPLRLRTRGEVFAERPWASPCHLLNQRHQAPGLFTKPIARVHSTTLYRTLGSGRAYRAPTAHGTGIGCRSVSYSGLVRVLDPDGVLLTVGEAELNNDADLNTWSGSLRVLDGTGVARKALLVKLAIGDRVGNAQLKPDSFDGEMAISKVIGLGPPPF
jgi:hypothetical protein